MRHRPAPQRSTAQSLLPNTEYCFRVRALDQREKRRRTRPPSCDDRVLDSELPVRRRAVIVKMAQPASHRNHLRQLDISRAAGAPQRQRSGRENALNQAAFPRFSAAPRSPASATTAWKALEQRTCTASQVRRQQPDPKCQRRITRRDRPAPGTANRLDVCAQKPGPRRGDGLLGIEGSRQRRRRQERNGRRARGRKFRDPGKTAGSAPSTNR